METMGKSKNPTTRQGSGHHDEDKSGSRTRAVNFEGVAENSRTSKFCQFCCPKGSAQSSTVSNFHEFTASPATKDLPTTTRCLRGTKLVGPKLPKVNTSSVPSSNKFPGYRCIGSSVGGTTEQFGFVRKLVARRESAALQSKRNASNIIRSSEPSSLASSKFAPHSKRQQNCGHIPTKGRRYEDIIPVGNNLSNSEFVRPTSDTLQHTLHSGQIQQSCGPLIASSPTSRMALTTDLCRNSVCKVGNPNNRPICLSDCSCSVQLCVSRPKRSSGSVPRCLQCPMELPARMDISTTIPSPQSPVSLKPVDRNILNSSTAMGKGLLACRSQSPSARGSINSEKPTEIPNRHDDGPSTTEGREHRPRSLEMWGWSDTIKTWNAQQLLLLRNSWRKSTLKTYEVAWKRWASWCRNKNLDFMNPPGSQLAQFLCDLYLINKLSYNSILLHKSVISTLCNADNSSRLSSHVLVRHVLKSIALKNPKVTKPPVWDVGKLISFLTNYTIDSNNLFQTSRHTAILLLLCSGRRIHDLTLLNIDSKHCIRIDNGIIFWPRFGSKTDSSNYRQSGWKLLLNIDSSILDPIFWIERTIALLNERRNEAKSTNLFITVRGVAKPASRTVIAGWVKTLFGEAGIAATPGSTRSAVASKSWFQNHPLDEILARGNWRSANTFQKFYRREIMRSTDSPNVTQLFNPID